MQPLYQTTIGLHVRVNEILDVSLYIHLYRSNVTSLTVTISGIGRAELGNLDPDTVALLQNIPPVFKNKECSMVGSPIQI